jgi:putative methanogenesis marker protein 8
MDGLRRDIHVVRYFSSYVSVSRGRVINITEPTMTYCPLANHLYRDFSPGKGADTIAVKKFIKKAIESKIREFGLFTLRRQIRRSDAAVPFGASEMLMCALRKRVIAAAVVVCEGAGSVITDDPEVVQGVGARMNTLLLTSPIKTIIKQLKQLKCRVVFESGLIDQAEGARTAAGMGYKHIAVTVAGSRSDTLKELRAIESENNVAITVLVICTTGIGADQIEHIRQHADLVWACGSSEVREMIGRIAVLQISKQIPVFVLTRRGLKFAAAYARNASAFAEIKGRKQFLISNDHTGKKIHMGAAALYLREARLPVLSRMSPVIACETVRNVRKAAEELLYRKERRK